jgi:polysaccharide deacetylase family protein (PEP-CTERM system associated)
MNAVMSVDVEEWFHIPEGLDNIIPFDKWEGAVQRIQHVLPRFWDLFEKNNVTATFFFLGWVAEKYPVLVKETLRRGHGVATHGYAHKLIYNQTPDEFRHDIYKAISIIENISGRKVLGYRAPGFSITPETEWAFSILAEHGIIYDSSIFPGKRLLGHYDKFDKEPVMIKVGDKEILEFPQTVVDFGILRLSCFGGGYFRIFPLTFFLKMAGIIQKQNRPLILYIHPRDIDKQQPELSFPPLRHLRHYINISKAEQKLDNIAGKFDFKSFESFISDETFVNGILAEAKSIRL